jgi:hypothetical protein
VADGRENKAGVGDCWRGLATKRERLRLAFDGNVAAVTSFPRTVAWRGSNAFSKKAVNHAHMMAIYFMHYNFVRIHKTLKITPAMAANVTPKLWEMSDMVKVLEDWEVSQ